MADTPDAREVPVSAIEEMVEMVDDAWKLQGVDPAQRGFCSTYRVRVATDGPTRVLYLKASPDGQTWGIPVEARIQSILATNTTVPVPEILSVVDDHQRLPTPAYLMSALPGEELPYEAVTTMDDDVLRCLARETGENLGAVHSLSAVDQFGQVDYDGDELVGETPRGDPETLTVDGGEDAWPDYLAEYARQELDRHADSRFSEITSEIREWVDGQIADMDGPFEPVLGRNDHGLHNLLVDPTTGEITGMLDWNYTLAVPPAFDFEFAAYIYSGAFFAGREDVADRRPLVRDAMLSGYRQTAPELLESVSTRDPLSQALAVVRVMNDFDSLDCPDGTESEITAYLRADVLSMGGDISQD